MYLSPRNNLRVAIFRHTLFKRSEHFIPMQALALRNSDVTMVARDPIINSIPELKTETLERLGRANKLRHTLFADSRPLKSVLKEGGFDVVHAHFGVEGLYSFSAAKQLDIPHFTTLHGYDVTRTESSFLTSGKPAWLRYGLQRKQFISSAQNLICVSSFIQQKAIELGAEYERTHVIGTGVDTQAILPSPVPVTPTVLHVARLVENKGTNDLISAFSAVLKKIPEAQLKIIGDGPLMPALKSQVESLGISNSVNFMGSQPHHIVIKELSNSRLFCLPSFTASTGDTEGLGQAILEASASARPVLATKSGGISDGVVEGLTGTLIEERNVQQLTEAIYLYLENWNTANEHGLSGRAFVEENFDVYKQARKLEQLYRQG